MNTTAAAAPLARARQRQRQKRQQKGQARTVQQGCQPRKQSRSGRLSRSDRATLLRLMTDSRYQHTKLGRAFTAAQQLHGKQFCMLAAVYLRRRLPSVRTQWMRLQQGGWRLICTPCSSAALLCAAHAGWRTPQQAALPSSPCHPHSETHPRMHAAAAEAARLRLVQKQERQQQHLLQQRQAELEVAGDAAAEHAEPVRREAMQQPQAPAPASGALLLPPASPSRWCQRQGVGSGGSLVL